MSHESNTAFYTRVMEFIDEHEGMSYIPKHAEKLFSEERYEELGRFMASIEADESRESFHGEGVF